ncbi:hypothetical protein Aple_044240 [Acrocarpospora pleiomorpha]|uniref:Uncharacterized protein n=1 Tax=Acrocarpospora pleiomorpha TaxID=90975 RepID=A0A5M3XT05_9ACTN|nr:hypothetical protein [Acrocarpospora pleiomorpha]GES21528.1 hypothetical protein Aple_044240 [Acrocarpospora pleiomorpha]
MSVVRKRWAMLAQDLTFEQLATVRKQAEGWRTALAGLTALLSTVLIIKGRDSVTSLATVPRWTATALLGLAFAMLIVATLSSVRAASGNPGTEILLTGEELRTWTQTEVRHVGRLIYRATLFTITALALLALAVGITWLAPSAQTDRPLIEVLNTSGRVCGELVGTADGALILKTAKLRQVPLIAVTSVTPVTACT